ncbi:MAG: hypothetical protein U0574_02780 [Phycisphaerales bacterium]
MHMRTFAAACLTAFSILVGTTASAQFGGRTSMADAFTPDIMERDMPLFVETLQLEEWQLPIVESLIQDYRDSFRAGVEGVKQKMSEAKGGPGKQAPPDIDAILKPIDSWTREKDALHKRFLEDLRSQLSEQQMERWPKLERAIRRERLLDQGELAGESVNLLGIARDLQVPHETLEGASAAFDTYETRLDEALVMRQSKMEEQVPALRDAMAAMDFEKGLQAQEKIMAARVAVREVQDQSVLLIAAALGEEWGPKFQDRAMRRAYPEVMVEDPVMRQVDAALHMTDLSEDQLTAIVNLKAAFQKELDDVNGRLLTAIRTEEPKEPRRRYEAVSKRGSANTVPNPAGARNTEVDAAKRSRGEISEKYRQQLMSILTPEQASRLPGAGKLDAKSGPKTPREAVAGEQVRQMLGGEKPRPSDSRRAAQMGGIQRREGGRGRDAGGGGGTAPPPARTAD